MHARKGVRQPSGSDRILRGRPQPMCHHFESIHNGLPAVEMQGNTADSVGKGGDGTDGHGAGEQGDERSDRHDPPEAQPGDQSDRDGRQQGLEQLGPERVGQGESVLPAEVAAQEEDTDNRAQHDGDGRG
jgi:hypothetical protein